MSEHFDAGFWHEHWSDPERQGSLPPHPEVVRVGGALAPGSALDAGCGTGTEALWLAEHGWDVTGVDVSRAALDQARSRDTSGSVRWLEADLTTWSPDASFDLVASQYAHAPIPQLDLYRRLADWVAPGGTLLLVGHAPHSSDEHEPDDSPASEHPHEATAELADVVALFDPSKWEVLVAVESDRTVPHGPRLHDVVVEARHRLEPLV